MVAETSVGPVETGKYYEFNLDVPLNACPNDELKGHELTLRASDKSSEEPAFDDVSVDVACMENAKVFFIQKNKPIFKPGDVSK